MSTVIESATDSSSEEPLSQPAASSDGRLIAGRFRLLEPLGRGGMGRVYRARDELLGRLVAVKLIYDDSIIDSDVRHACALEARAAARLSHPGIVRILDSGFDDGHLYVVMSLADGHTLSDIIRAGGPLPAERALDIAMQVADALDAAHQDGIVHCDVKPSNLIVRPDGIVQLVDFGIARIAASTTNLDASTLQGSAEYVAPEQVEGNAVDGRTDLYALGVVLFEMLAGRTPFGGGTIAAVLGRRLVNDPPSVLDDAPHLSVAVDRLVRRMLARDPADRFQTAGQLHSALAAARRDVVAATLPPPPAASVTATMPISGHGQRRPSAGIGSSARMSAAHVLARVASATREHTVRLRESGVRAVVVSAAATLAMMRYAHLIADGVRPFFVRQLARADSGTRSRVCRPSLVPGVGIAVVLGLLIGTAAARCSVVGASAEAAVAPAAAEVQAQPTVVVAPAALIVEPAATHPPVPTATPTAPPPAASEPTVQPTLVVEPTAVPPLPVAPALVPAPPPAQPIQTLAAPAVPPREPPGQEKKPEPAKPEAQRPDPPKKEDAPAPKPEAKKPKGNGPQKKR